MFGRQIAYEKEEGGEEKMTWLKVSLGAFLVLGLLVIGAVTSDQAYAGSDTATLGVTMHVDGMSCMGCVSKVEASLLEVPGVKSADVSLEKNEAKVEYDKDKVTVEQLVAAVKKAGYEAHSKE